MTRYQSSPKLIITKKPLIDVKHCESDVPHYGGILIHTDIKLRFYLRKPNFIFYDNSIW